MLYTSDAKPITDRFPAEMADLRTLARLHGLLTGTAECLAGLPLRISQDSRLRSDLAEMVRSLQARDPDLALPDVLSLIVLAIGGPEATGRNRALDEPLDLLGGFLASLGGWAGADLEPLTDLDNPPDHDPRLDMAAAQRTDGDLPQLLNATRNGAGPHPVAAPQAIADPATLDGGSSTASDAASPSEITNALARLERGNLELRLHLDSIDQRISRMEPLLEGAPIEAHPDLADHAPPSAADFPLPRGASFGEAPAPALDDFVARTPPANLASPAAPEPSPAFADHRPLSDGLNFRRITLAATEVQSEVLDRAEMLARRAEAVAARRAGPPDRPLAPSVNRTSAPPAGQTSEPITQPRVGPSRRDRFAAARELPGVSPELDPLYLEPDPTASEPPARAAEQPARPRAAAPSRDLAPDLPISLASSASVLPPLPLSAPAAKSSGPVMMPAAPRSTASVSVEPARREDASLPLNDTRPAGGNPPLAPSYPLFGSIAGESTYRPDEAAEPHSHRGRWIAGIAASLVIASAGFLYVNGLPSSLTGWLAGQTVASSPAASPIPLPSVTSAPQATPTPRRSSSSTARRPDAASPQTRASQTASQITPQTAPAATSGAAPATGRVLDAREAFVPHVSTEITAAPTFVPGPVMDGRLISAPRPEYPRVANFVGLEGKVVFEAMISKDGDIEALKVLGGNHLLRDAALNAVRQWRYRPFLTKAGTPVEVRTIIRVDVSPASTTAAEN